MADYFNGMMAARLLGVSYWLLHEWDRGNLLRPSRRIGTGPRPRKAYSFRDLVAARTLVMLRQAGVSGQRVRKVVQKLQSTDVIASSKLVVIGTGRRTDVQLVQDERTLQSLVMQPGQTAVRSFLLVEIGAELETLRKRVAAEVARKAA